MSPTQPGFAASLSVRILSCAFVCSSACGQATEAGDKASVPLGGNETVALYLPTPMAESELSRYDDLLVLSDEQRYVVSGLHERYLERYAATTAELIGKLSDMARIAAEMQDHSARAPVFESLSKGQRDLYRRVEQMDGEFFDEVMSILADSQAESMYSVRLERNRVRCGTCVELADLPEARVNLVDILVGLEALDGGDERIHALADSYTESWYSLIRRLAERHFKCIVEDYYLTSPLLTADATPELERAVMAERRRLWRPHVNLSKQLERHNRLYLQLIADSLPEDISVKLTSLYREKCYWELYPDNSRRRAILQAAVELEELTPEKREAMEAIILRYEHQYEESSKKAEVAVRSLREMFAQRTPLHVDAIQDARDRVERAIQERSTITDEAFELLRDALGPDDLKRLAARF